MEDARCVRLDAPASDPLQVKVSVVRGKPNDVRRIARRRSGGAEVVIHDRPRLLDRTEGHVEVVRGREVPHEDPICDPRRGHASAVPEEGYHVRRAIEPQVLRQVSIRDRVRFAGIHARGLRADGDWNREVPDPREKVHHYLPRTDPRWGPQSLRKIPGGEHDARDIEREANPAFRVDRLRPGSPEDANVRKAEGTVDSGAVFHDRPGTEGRPENSADFPLVGTRLLRETQDNDVPDPLPSRRDDILRESRLPEPLREDFLRSSLDRTIGKAHDVREVRVDIVEGKVRVAQEGDDDLVAALRDPDRPIQEALRTEAVQEFVRPTALDNCGPHPTIIVRPMFHPLARYLYENLAASPRIMRATALVLALLLVGLAFLPHAAAEDFGAVGKVNKLIDVHSTPELAPGESGRFEFELNVTYAEEIVDATLNVSIYRYATIEESLPVDSTWPFDYPYIDVDGTNVGQERQWTFPRLNGSKLMLNFTVVTHADSHEMPHGSVFSQASYFVRFYLSFTGNVSGSPEPFVMASPGYFTEAQWDEATSEARTDPCIAPTCRGYVNLTVLGVDGILPDSAFGVKEPIPRWPFYALVAASVFFLVLAFLFWVEENPGSYPRVEAWWARTRGRLVRTFAPWRQRKPRKT